MKLCVTGGRDFNDADYVFIVLDMVHGHTPVTELIHGNATGADTLAGKWAAWRGIKETALPAEWHKHGYLAGMKRNRELLYLKPDYVLAFPGNKGTRDMILATLRERIPLLTAHEVYTIWHEMHYVQARRP